MQPVQTRFTENKTQSEIKIISLMRNVLLNRRGTILAFLFSIVLLCWVTYTLNVTYRFIWHSPNARFERHFDKIISDLALPYEPTFLTRSLVINEITSKFDNPAPIRTIVLVGIGGAGKTTIARYYARQQKVNIIWEINAETKESLNNSFKELAYALSKNEEDRKLLKENEEIKNIEDREKKLVFL